MELLIWLIAIYVAGVILLGGIALVVRRRPGAAMSLADTAKVALLWPAVIWLVIKAAISR